MKWGFFNMVHIASLILAAAMLTILYICLRKASRGVQTGVMGTLSFLGIAAIVHNLVTGGAVLANLPLQLCSINAMLLPAAVFTKNKALGNLLLVWCLGALAALILNNDLVGQDVFSTVSFFYYFPHVVEFGIPVLLFKLGLVQKDAKCIGSTLGITLAIYTIVHLINKLIQRFAGLDVNYFFTIRPNNPLAALFYRLVPYEYWYMYLVLPIVLMYLLVVYAPQLRAGIRRCRQKETAKTAP